LGRLAIEDGRWEKDSEKRWFARWLEMVPDLGSYACQLDDFYALQSRYNFKILWVRQTSAHSPRTLAKPRKRKRRNPRAGCVATLAGEAGGKLKRP
jgi:hypothetical protein